MARNRVITTGITEEQIRDLEGLGSTMRKSRAVLIREAIDEYLGSRRDLISTPEPDPRQVPLDLTGSDHRACGTCPECAKGLFAECTYYSTLPM